MVASLLLQRSVDHAAFDLFVNELLLPHLRRGDVLLWDNLPAHKASNIEQSVAQAKAEVIWLPAYSPDFSPNENCWLKIKTLVRGQQPRTVPDLNQAVSTAIQAMTRRYCCLVHSLWLLVPIQAQTVIIVAKIFFATHYERAPLWW